MANATPIQTEPDVRTEAVENALPSVLLQHHSEIESIEYGTVLTQIK